MKKCLQAGTTPQRLLSSRHTWFPCLW